MADISDVENALVSLISSGVYPNGTSQPSAIALANGTTLDCRVYSGWPLPAQIDADMASGSPPGSAPIINISVWPQTGLERNTTRFPRDWKPNAAVPCSMTATVSGVTVTIGGTVTAGHYVTIQAGNYTASYAALASDTVASIASALRSLLAASMACSVAGPVLTLPSVMVGRIVTRTAAPGTSSREVDRTNQRFQITIWAPNNEARVAAAKIVRPLLGVTDFLPLPDGYAVELHYESSTDIDRTGKQSISCRDFFWWGEYPTTQTMVSNPVTTFSIGFEADLPTTKITSLPLSSFTPTITVIN